MNEIKYHRQFQEFMQNADLPSEIMNWLNTNGFFAAPASTKYHGAYEGGLYRHSITVAKHLVQLTAQNNLTWQKPRSPYLVGMFHDICKMDAYRHPTLATLLDGERIPNEGDWEYNPNTLFKGHGEKSVLLLSQFFTLTEEEVACIVYHMGAFTDKEAWSAYTNAIHRYPNVLWTHHADMLATHVDGV